MKSEWQERMRGETNHLSPSFVKIEVDAEPLFPGLGEMMMGAIRKREQEVEATLKKMGFTKYEHIPKNLAIQEWVDVIDGKVCLCWKLVWLERNGS